jgi:hypothetical protein
MNISWRWPIAALAAALVLSAGLLPAPAQAQDMEKKITVNFRDTPLRDAINIIFTGSGLQFSVDPNVPNVPINLNIRDVGLQAALRMIIRQAAVAVPGLTFNRDADVFVVRIRQAPPPMATSEELPPEFDDTATEVTWEKIPIQFNNVAVFVLAFGGTMLPTEDQVVTGMLGGGFGGGFGGGIGGQQGGFGGGGFGGQQGGFGGGGFGGGGFGGGGFGGGGFGGGGFGGGGFGGLGGGGFGGGGLGGFGGGGFGGLGGGGFGGGGGGRFF